jgi:ELWxxDGT repeat protein
MLFSNPDAEHGFELWRSDGTLAGTTLVQDLAPGPDSSYPQRFVRAGTSILMMADDLIGGYEVFAGRTQIVLGHPLAAVSDLKTELSAAGLPRGPARSLEVKLDAAAAAIAAGRPSAAIVHLRSFERGVELRSHRIGEDAAADLIFFSEDLRALLETPVAGPAPEAPRGAVDLDNP